MNEKIYQFLMLLRTMPFSKKISIVFTVLLLIAGFALMFFLANKINYQVLFNNLSQPDAGAIVDELQKQNIPYKIEGNGSVILVPNENVLELRLSLVAEGLPREGHVGFEIFDKTDFKTTKFVQELNYQRALQGELARTIVGFKEVSRAKVFIVMPKKSLFVEEAKSPSASIQLGLKSDLPPGRLSAIIHLVASAVEGLDPGQITVVDTKGRVIFKGGNGDDRANLLSGTQLDYKSKVEDDIRNNIQSMLEGIVGIGKAIVRVTAEVDFNKVTLNEEEYDPAAAAVRSKRAVEESSQAGKTDANIGETIVNQRAGVLPSSDSSVNGKMKKDTVTNYEINKVTRAIFKPAGSIKRISVAAVIDGTYEVAKAADGIVSRTYSPRTEDEIGKFETIVKNAMGYNEDREDQVSVSSIPFFDNVPMGPQEEKVEKWFDILQIIKNAKTSLINIALGILVFFILIRPLMKNLNKMTAETVLDQKQLSASGENVARIENTGAVNPREKVLEISRQHPEKTEQLIKGWIGE